MKLNKVKKNLTIAIITLLFSVQSYALTINEIVNGISYDITLSPLTSANEIENTLRASPIYGNMGLSDSLTSAVNTKLGLPNTAANGASEISFFISAAGPLFVSGISPSSFFGTGIEWSAWYNNFAGGGGGLGRLHKAVSLKKLRMF